MVRHLAFLIVVCSLGFGPASAQGVERETRPLRVRDLGVAIGRYQPGPWNAITDVEGVMVGHVTLIEGDGALVPGKGPVRTGVTVIIPRENV